jgi:hypothetical protein
LYFKVFFFLTTNYINKASQAQEVLEEQQGYKLLQKHIPNTNKNKRKAKQEQALKQHHKAPKHSNDNNKDSRDNKKKPLSI